jgi:iron complex outermembrane receptor protein
MRSTCAVLLAASSLFVLSTSVFAQTGEAAGADVAALDEEIVVFGSGQTRQVQELDAADIALLAPGTSPLKSIEKLPSVNFQSADAFGAYEWSQRLSIRGFNQNQLGFTLDGIPLGDHSYGNVNGLHVNRAISPENLGLTRVSQGSGGLGTQATNNLGGTVEFFSRAPAPDFGLDVSGSYGTENTIRAFARLESGEIGGVEGTGAYISYGYLGMDKWKGVGEQRHHMLNAKAVAALGDARVTATLSVSDRRENDYQDMSKEMIGRLGYDWDNISGDYRLAVQVADAYWAGTALPAPFATVDDAYFDAAGLRKDYLAAIGVEAPVSEAVKVALKGYWHNNEGQGIWYTPYVQTPGGAPLSVRTTEYDIDRKGLFGSITGDIAFNEITVGGWYEKNDFQQARRFYGLTDRLSPSRDSLKFQKDPFFTQWESDFDTETMQYHVEDRITLGAATITLGWKGFKVTNTATPIVVSTFAQGKIKAEDWFQPHAGFAYEINDYLEMFGGFTQVARAFTASSTGGPFGTTQAGFDAIKGNLKPEESDTYEAGFRFRGSNFNGVVGAYYVNFRNRLLGFSTGAGIIGNPAVLQNVGSVRSYGLEAAGEVKLGAGFKLFASYSYNDSTYQDDVVNAAGTLIAATDGKTTVDSPKHLAKGELSYDGELFFGRIGVNYMSKRYYSYENDASVGGRAIVDASIGWRIAEGYELQVSGTNLLDKKYVSTVGTNGFSNRGDSQTLMIGAPRQVFATLKAAF